MKRNAAIPLVVFVILGFSAAVLGILGGYFWYQSQQEEEIICSGLCDPRVPFTTFTDPDFGYSISYPGTWFIESYNPWGRLGTGEPGSQPEYLLALATIAGNYAPDLSQAGEVIQLHITRLANTSNETLEGLYSTFAEDWAELGVTVKEEKITVSGRQALSHGMIWCSADMLDVLPLEILLQLA